MKIISDKTKKSLRIKKKIAKFFQSQTKNLKNLIIVIGGDGFMLQTLKKFKNSSHLSFYGINSGNYGFLMNKFNQKKIFNNILKAKRITISPLEMTIKKKSYLAINEVSVLRQSRQAASLSVKSGSKYIIKNLVGDGVLVSTPAGSTAYNLSVYGPILNLDSKKISIAPISAFRPRRWKGKLISNKSTITIKNLDFLKRPVSAVADNIEIRRIKQINIRSSKKFKFNLIYDKNRSLQQKIKLEQIKSETY